MAMPTPCMQIGENPPYKGGWLKIGSFRRGEPEYSKPQISSQVVLFTAPLPMNEVRRPSLNVNLRPRVVLDTQVWLPASKGDREATALQKALCLILEENVGQRLWEELERWADTNQEWNQRRLSGQVCQAEYRAFTYDLIRVSLGIPGLGWLPPLI